MLIQWISEQGQKSSFIATMDPRTRTGQSWIWKHRRLKYRQRKFLFKDRSVFVFDKQKAWAVQKPTWMEKVRYLAVHTVFLTLYLKYLFSENFKLKIFFSNFSVCRLYFDWPFRRFGTLFKMSKMNNFSNFCYFKKWKKRGHGWPWSWVFFQ